MQQHQVVHADLSLLNILGNKYGIAKIIDLDLAIENEINDNFSYKR